MRTDFLFIILLCFIVISTKEREKMRRSLIDANIRSSRILRTLVFNRWKIASAKVSFARDTHRRLVIITVTRKNHSFFSRDISSMPRELNWGKRSSLFGLRTNYQNGDKKRVVFLSLSLSLVDGSNARAWIEATIQLCTSRRLTRPFQRNGNELHHFGFLAVSYISAASSTALRQFFCDRCLWLFYRYPCLYSYVG